MKERQLTKIALLGSYLPRKCGIATFSSDVFSAIAAAAPNCDVQVIALNDTPQTYKYPNEVRFVIEQEQASYRRAADFINASEFDVLFIQHEFGLFAGSAGAMLFELLDNIRIPVVTLLHTILKNPDEDQFRVTRRLAARSSELVTMSERGKNFLRDIYEIDVEKVTVVPHGIPDIAFDAGEQQRCQFGWNGKKVGLTFGLLSPGKGIEYAIDAVPEVVKCHPDFVYVLLGATHPHLIRHEGEKYRESLMQRVVDLGVKDHVIFENRFVDIELLKDYIAAADIYLTPYLNETQITSGTLSYAYGNGKPIVSTPYWHAEDLLRGGKGELVPFRDAAAISKSVNLLFNNEPLRQSLRVNAYQEGRQMIWSAVGAAYVETLDRANSQMFNVLSELDKPRDIDAVELEIVLDQKTPINLSHLRALSDETGIIQHATYSVPNLHEGYCTDDNARAFLLTILLDELDSETQAWTVAQTRYASFLDFAIDIKTGLVRNFMGYNRQWLETQGSEDSLGRTIWTLGYCVGKTQSSQLRSWAARLFEIISHQALTKTSPRSWAFAMLGAAAYQSHFTGEQRSQSLMIELAERLVQRFNDAQLEGWQWFERGLTYDNAQICHAMLRVGAACRKPEWIDIGLKTLNWLCQLQTSEAGHFQPIGNRGFYAHQRERAVYDQQPLEAWSTMTAALGAFEVTNDKRWYNEAVRAIEWFLGRNDLGQTLVDLTNGSCCDGLQYDRVNRNQGAESTLAWLCAIAELKLVQRRMAAESQRQRRIGSSWVRTTK